MSVFVVVALALAVLSVAMVVVAVLQVITAVRGLLEVVREQVERIGPLADELQAEAAVAGTELEALEDRRRAWEAARAQRRRARRGSTRTLAP